jgi:hypothetical protein
MPPFSLCPPKIFSKTESEITNWPSSVLITVAAQSSTSKLLIVKSSIPSTFDAFIKYHPEQLLIDTFVISILHALPVEKFEPSVFTYKTAVEYSSVVSEVSQVI